MKTCRISVVFATSGLAGAFSGLLSSAIIKMEGVAGHHGWSWIFILVSCLNCYRACSNIVQEGIFTILFGFASFFLLPRTIDHATFLNSDNKCYLKERLRAEGMTDSNPSDQFNWRDLVEAFKSPHVILIAIIGFFGGSTQGGLA